MSTGGQLTAEGGVDKGARGEKGEISPALFKKYLKSALIWKKSILILQKCSVFVCIYGLNSHLRCSFKNIFKKKHEHFSLRGFFFCVQHMKHISKCPYSEKPSLPGKFQISSSKIKALLFDVS